MSIFCKAWWNERFGCIWRDVWGDFMIISRSRVVSNVGDLGKGGRDKNRKTFTECRERKKHNLN